MNMIDQSGTEELVCRLMEILRGQDPVTVGTALADLTAIWMGWCSTQGSDVEELINLHIDGIRTFLPVRVKMGLERETKQ